jgi:hypothetical protein
MSRIWIEIFLGKIGKYVIDFFSKYYIWFIPLIVLYGLFMSLSSYNLRRMEKKVSIDIIKQAKYLIRRNPEINFVGLVENIVINWKGIVRSYSFFPFIANEFDLWVVRTSPKALRTFIFGDENKMRTILERNNIYFKELPGSVRKNLYIDLTRRIFKRRA